jgi:hypothetical protein
MLAKHSAVRNQWTPQKIINPYAGNSIIAACCVKLSASRHPDGLSWHVLRRTQFKLILLAGNSMPQSKAGMVLAI